MITAIQLIKDNGNESRDQFITGNEKKEDTLTIYTDLFFITDKQGTEYIIDARENFIKTAHGDGSFSLHTTGSGILLDFPNVPYDVTISTISDSKDSTFNKSGILQEKNIQLGNDLLYNKMITESYKQTNRKLENRITFYKILVVTSILLSGFIVFCR